MGAKPPKWQNVKMALMFGPTHIPLGEVQHSIETGDLEIFADVLLPKFATTLIKVFLVN